MHQLPSSQGGKNNQSLNHLSSSVDFQAKQPTEDADCICCSMTTLKTYSAFFFRKKRKLHSNFCSVTQKVNPNCQDLF